MREAEFRANIRERYPNVWPAGFDTKHDNFYTERTTVTHCEKCDEEYRYTSRKLDGTLKKQMQQ